MRKYFFTLTACAILGSLPALATAGTIIKLNLGSVAPDVQFAGGVFSTANDGDPITPGNQNTAVEYTDFLETEVTDINTPVASFTLDNLSLVGQAQVVMGVTVIQNFQNGNFTLWAPDNSTILLQGTLANSTLAGPLGFPSGGLFTTSFGSFSGGTLLPYVEAGSLVMSMNFTNVQTTGGGAGFSVTPPPAGPPYPLSHLGDLRPFTANASINIDGLPAIPEPATTTLVLVGAVVAANALRRRR